MAEKLETQIEFSAVENKTDWKIKAGIAGFIAGILVGGMIQYLASQYQASQDSQIKIYNTHKNK